MWFGTQEKGGEGVGHHICREGSLLLGYEGGGALGYQILGLGCGTYSICIESIKHRGPTEG